MKRAGIVLIGLMILQFSTGCTKTENPTDHIQTHSIKYQVTSSTGVTSITSILYKSPDTNVPIMVTNPTLPWELTVTLSTGDGYSLQGQDVSGSLNPVSDKITVSAFRDSSTTAFSTATSGDTSIDITIAGTVNE